MQDPHLQTQYLLVKNRQIYMTKGLWHSSPGADQGSWACSLQIDPGGPRHSSCRHGALGFWRQERGGDDEKVLRLRCELGYSWNLAGRQA